MLQVCHVAPSHYFFGLVTSHAEQILSGKVPYHHYSRDAQIIATLFRGETPARPDDPRITDRRWNFMQRCWSSFRDIVQRPSSEEIVAFSTDDLSRHSL